VDRRHTVAHELGITSIHRTAAPSTEGVIALRGDFLGVPTAHALLAELDLVLVGLLALTLDLGIVSITLLASTTAGSKACEESGSKKDGGTTSRTSVNGDLSSVWQVLPLLSEGQWWRGIERLRDGGVATMKVSSCTV
jgi:hypothetical protein